MTTPAVDVSRRSQPIARALRVTCVDDPWGFTALRPQWNELLRSSRANGPFMTWEWLHTWWRHLQGGGQLRILSVRAGHELIALAPLTLTRGELGTFRRLDFLGTGHAGSDYLDLIVRDGHEEESHKAIARYLISQQTTLRFDHLPPSSAAASLAEYLTGQGWTTITSPGGICPIIPLAGQTWESYLSSLGSSHRANVRRRLKALGERFDMRFDRVTTDADRRAGLAALAEWHERRFEGRGGTTAFTNGELRAFHDEATRRMLDRGWLRMYVLRLNGAPAAVMYGFLYGRQFYFYQHGFDDQYRQHSTGLALMALSVRAAIDEGAETFDMLWGTESYKALWAREHRVLQQIHLFPPHLGGRLHRRALQARRHLGTLARRVFPAREGVRGT